MEFKINTKKFAKAIVRAKGVLKKEGSGLSCISRVLLVASMDGHLKILSTDLDISISQDLECEVLSDGAVSVPGKRLYDIVNSFNSPEVSVKQLLKELIIKGGVAECRIDSYASEEFPVLPKSDNVPFVSVDNKIILSLINRTLFASSSDDTRYCLNSVFFESIKDSVRMVATDGHRLVLAEEPLIGDFGLKKGVIIPKVGMVVLGKLLSKSKEIQGELGFSELFVVYRSSGIELMARLIEGSFPDYLQVIPDNKLSLAFNRQQLLDMLRRILKFSSSKELGATLDFSKGSLRIFSNSATETIDTCYCDRPFKVRFNLNFLVDVLSTLDTEDVTISFANNFNPCVIKPVCSKYDLYTALVMPMHM